MYGPVYGRNALENCWYTQQDVGPVCEKDWEAVSMWFIDEVIDEDTDPEKRPEQAIDDVDGLTAASLK